MAQQLPAVSILPVATFFGIGSSEAQAERPSAISFMKTMYLPYSAVGCAGPEFGGQFPGETGGRDFLASAGILA